MKQARIRLTVAIFIATFYTSLFAFPARTPRQFEQASSGFRQWNVILVEFQEDSSPVTTGNGKFLQTPDDSDYEYILDPPPHNKAYFHSHLKAISNYWRSVTHNGLQIDTSAALILPSESASITLPRKIRDYHPADKPDSVDYKLAELVYETLKTLHEEENPSLNETLIIFHAGVGQDFDFSEMYDPTPYDIPSFYFDEVFLSAYLHQDKVAFIQSLGVERGIVLPEMQNQLELNVALNGTAVLLSGFLVGLPPLYNTETGKSGTGIFGLMDQGSNNANGLLPIHLSAFERILMDVQTPQNASVSRRYSIPPGDIMKIPLSSREYFLVEYRRNAGIWLDSLYQSHNHDTIPEEKQHKTYLDALEKARQLGHVDYYLNPKTGVLEWVDNYDITLPTSGLLIWHIYDPDKALFQFPENPNGGSIPMVRLEEADGGYDIGKNYGYLSGNVNQGWKWDIWFTKNTGFLDNNSHIYNIKDIEFSDRTHPNTRSFSEIPSHVSLKNFTFASDSASFNLNLPMDQTVFHPGFTAHGASKLGLFNRSFPFGIKDNQLVSLSDTGYVQLTKFEDPAPKAENLTILPFENQVVIIHASPDKNRLLVYNTLHAPPRLNLLKSRPLPHPVHLSSVSAFQNTILLPDTNETDPGFSLYSVATDHFTEKISTVSSRITGLTHDKNLLITNGPFLQVPEKGLVNQLAFPIGPAVSYGDSLILTDREHGGFYYYNTSEQRLLNQNAFLPDELIYEIIPLDHPETKGPDFVILSENDSRKRLILCDADGHPWPGFPINSPYESVRIYFNKEELRIAAAKENGRVDIRDKTGNLLNSHAITPEAVSFFLSKNTEKISMISEGDIISLDGDSVHWGYAHGDLTGTRHITPAYSFTPLYPTAVLIADNLIYNYPNPVSGKKTAFRYYAVSAQSVDISIYDLRGKFVEHLHQVPIQNQWNELEWHVRDLDSGVYIAKITVSGAGKEQTFIIKPAILK